MEIKLKLFKKIGNLSAENNFKTIDFKTLKEAQEAAEYFYHTYFYQSQVLNEDGSIYVEFEN